MRHEIRRNADGTPWVVFIPTEPDEVSFRPMNGPREAGPYEAVLTDLGMSRAGDLVGPVKLQHPALGFPGVVGPPEGSLPQRGPLRMAPWDPSEGGLYRISFEQGCALLGIRK